MMSKAVLILPVLIILLVILPGAMAGSVVSSLKITVNLDGKPLANAVVELWHNGSLVLRGTTDSNGTVTFANVTAQDYTVYVYSGGEVYSATVNITNTTTALTLNFTSTTVSTNTTNNTMFISYDWLNQNKVLVVSGIAVFLFIILLIAYAFSGKKIPRRR